MNPDPNPDPNPNPNNPNNLLETIILLGSGELIVLVNSKPELSKENRGAVEDDRTFVETVVGPQTGLLNHFPNIKPSMYIHCYFYLSFCITCNVL